MQRLRRMTQADTPAAAACARCRATGCPWDCVGGCTICPDCLEELARGEGEPLRLPREARPCLVCNVDGTVPFVTVPLRAAAPIALDLCPAHLRALLRRGLERSAFHELAGQLRAAGFEPGHVFLLHEAFYDGQGLALQPVP